MNAIEVNGIGKKYSLVKSPTHRLFDLLGGAGKQRRGDFWALQDISFSVATGESFGIIGSNGSGKSTLLQIIAGVMQPTLGSLTVNGRMSAILELGAGFNPEFSGRDNVSMNAAILGLTEEQIKDRFPLIEEFAEIGDFIDQPVKTYSSGMLMRLAFSIAVHIDPQVLIVDEALAVGDIYFTQRCLRYLHRLRERGITMVFVSHSPTELRALCSRSMWLEHGRIQEMGETDRVVGEYLARARGKQSTASLPTATSSGEATPGDGWISEEKDSRPRKGLTVVGNRYGNLDGEVMEATVSDSTGQARSGAKAGDQIVIGVKMLAHKKLERPIVGFLMRNERGETIYGLNTTTEGHVLPSLEAGDYCTISFAWTAPQFVRQRYTFTVAIAEGDLATYTVCDYVEDLLSLEFEGPDPAEAGYIQLPCRVRVEVSEGSAIQTV
jgi:lipopolysaccharide transport system ATP-binding protein